MDIEQDVGGFEVAVDEVADMAVVKCLGDRRGQLDRFAQRRPALAQPLRQVTSLDELRYDVAQTVVGPAHVVDRHDVGMVELG